MKNETKNRLEKERLKENLDNILRNLSKELTGDDLTLFVLGLAKYIMLGFSELGVDYSKMYQTLIKIPKSISIIRDIYYGVDNPNKIINTYKLHAEDFHNFLREMEELGLISYDGRRIKMTEKGRRLYEILVEFVIDPFGDLLGIFDNYYSNINKRQENEEIVGIRLDLSDPAVRQWYEYLKSLEEKEKNNRKEDNENMWLPLDDPAVRQWYEYLKKKFEEESKSS